MRYENRSFVVVLPSGMLLLFSVIDELKTLLQSKGADLVGIADLRKLTPDVRNNFPVGISIAVALNPHIIANIQNGPTNQYYLEYKRVNDLLDKLGYSAVAFLNENGCKSISLAVTNIGIDSETLSTILPHKTTAFRAGLGWIGKCALLVTKTYGSAIRITTVLTDARLPTDNPVDTPLCGKCFSCVESCPVHAPSGKNWQPGMHRDDFYNAFACQENALEMARKNVGIRLTLCGICIAVCPWTQKYIKKAN